MTDTDSPLIKDILALRELPVAKLRERYLAGNTATLTADDKTFVARLGDAELSDVEFRALLEAHRTGRLDNARLRAISGLDMLGASALLRRLRDRELLALHAAGPNSYYELGSLALLPVEQTEGLEAETGQQTEGFPAQTEGLEPKTEGFGLPSDLREAIERLGGRPAPEALRDVIVALGRFRWWTAAELARVLGRKKPAHLTEKHLAPLVKEGRLERRYPDNPAHPQQAYRVPGTSEGAS